MEYERITSAKNPLLVHIRRLQKERAYRKERGEFVADSPKLLEEALRHGLVLRAVVCAEGVSCPSLPQGVRSVQVPQSLMQSLSSMRTPQGVVFTAQLPQECAPDLRGGTLVLDRIQDPGNLGTILRTADAFSVPVVLSEGCADPFSEKTLRASMGAVFRTPIYSATCAEILEQCRRKGLRLSVTALHRDATDIRSADLTNDVAVIGSEGQGVGEDFLRAAQRFVIIPMNPRCESLNAAVAAGLLLWQMRKAP